MNTGPTRRVRVFEARPVEFSDTRPLKMGAAFSHYDITLIEMTGDTNGVTPTDLKGFKAALGVRD